MNKQARGFMASEFLVGLAELTVSTDGISENI